MGILASRVAELSKKGERLGWNLLSEKKIAAILKEVHAPVNDSIMTTRLAFRKKLNVVFISVYAPTMTNP